MKTGRLNIASKPWKVPPRNARPGQIRILSAEEAGRIGNLIDSREREKQAQAIHPRTRRGPAKDIKKENNIMSRSAPRKTDIFTREVIEQIHSRLAAGESINKMRQEKYNGVGTTSHSTLIRYIQYYGLPWPLPEKPAGPPPAVSKPSRPAGLVKANGSVPAADPGPADQLTALQQLMATLQAGRLAVTGKVAIDLHIEMDISG